MIPVGRSLPLTMAALTLTAAHTLLPPATGRGGANLAESTASLRRCTMAVQASPPLLIPSGSDIAFLGSARPDTLGVPLVDAFTGMLSGFSLPSLGSTRFGQLVDIDRLSLRRPADMPPGERRVVLVPWGLGSNCGLTRWIASSRWLPIGMRGILYGSLRERRHWVQGIPTADVWVIRGHPIWPENPSPADSATTMNAQQALDLLDALPSDSSLQAAPSEAFRGFQAKLSARPRLHEKSVATVDAVREHIRDLTARALPMPAGGTYRLQIRSSSGTVYTLLIRTSASALNATVMYNPPQSDPTRPLHDFLSLRPSSVTLAMSAGGTEERLISGSLTHYPDNSMQIAAEGVRGAQGVIVWHAALVIPTDGVLNGNSGPTRRVIQPGDLPLGSMSIDALRIEQRPDGSFIIPETTVTTPNGEFRLSGERISNVTFAVLIHRQ